MGVSDMCKWSFKSEPLWRDFGNGAKLTDLIPG